MRCERVEEIKVDSQVSGFVYEIAGKAVEHWR